MASRSKIPGIYFVTTIPDPRPWLEALRSALGAIRGVEGGLEINLYPIDEGGSRAIIEQERKEGRASLLPLDPKPEDVEIAVIADPPPGLLKGLPKLKIMASLWAGVDRMLRDDTFPRQIPLVRMVDPEMTRSMAESVLMHTIWGHRQMHFYRELQDAAVWNKRPLNGLFQPMTKERTVGILGLGTLGRAAATVLVRNGFNVLGYTRSLYPDLIISVISEPDLAKPSSEISSTALKTVTVPILSGPEGLDQVLSRSQILINLLPLTPETANIINLPTLSKLPTHSVIINLARGGHVNEDDLIQALDQGIIAHAILDVFQIEPLPPTHRLWKHPKVTVTPHVSALTNPSTAGPIVAETIRRYLCNDPLENVVSWDRGY
ncbi:hypothetical protein HDU97_000444 [Phlyctochytrium planicorne]|nr:hypothetical protein HDU97_000444 [Phlyctochytrium planicorne]